jgi:RNA polymerase sigma-70 factor (ECF subfamily)
MTAQPKPLSRPPAAEADFEALYREQLPRIYNFFRYRFGDEALAEDLTSATFEKAWRSRERYRRDLSAFGTWLFTIARRLAVDHYRRRRADLPLEAAPPPDGENVEDSAQRRVDLARLDALLAGQSDRERELVALKYGAGLANREIARLTGMSESNVGVTLYRLVRALRAEWETNDG